MRPVPAQVVAGPSDARLAGEARRVVTGERERHADGVLVQARNKVGIRRPREIGPGNTGPGEPACGAMMAVGRLVIKPLQHERAVQRNGWRNSEIAVVGLVWIGYQRWWIQR